MKDFTLLDYIGMERLSVPPLVPGTTCVMLHQSAYAEMVVSEYEAKHNRAFWGTRKESYQKNGRLTLNMQLWQEDLPQKIRCNSLRLWATDRGTLTPF